MRNLKYVLVFILTGFAFPLNVILVVLLIKNDQRKDLEAELVRLEQQDQDIPFSE